MRKKKKKKPRKFKWTANSMPKHAICLHVETTHQSNFFNYYLKKKKKFIYVKINCRSKVLSERWYLNNNKFSLLNRQSCLACGIEETGLKKKKT